MHAVGTLAVSGDLLVAGVDRNCFVFRNGTMERQLAVRNTAGAISRDGRRLVTGAADQKVRVWDVQTGDQLLVFSDLVYAVADVRFVGRDRHIIALAHRWEAPTYIYAWHAPPEAELPR